MRAGTNYPFLTEQERDVETGLDYFLARYYSATAGRFTGSDPGRFTPADPQNFNRYSYAQNNPLKFVDPTGRDLYFTGSDADYIVAELERFTGLRLIRDAKTGRVNVDWSVKRKGKGTSTWLANKIAQVINDPRAAVAIETGRNQPGVFFDAFALKQLDVADYDAFKSADPKFAAASLAHVIQEYYFAEIVPIFDLPNYGVEVPAGGPRGPLSDFGIYVESHNDAYYAEGYVISDFTGWWEKPRGKRDSIFTTAGFIHIFEYSTVTYDVLVKNNAAGSPTVVSITKYENKKPRNN